MDIAILTVDKVQKHPNADRLDIIHLRGYQAVFNTGVLKVGDKVVYICTDAQVDLVQPWTEIIKKYVTQKGRVKTIRLRGEWSEGIILLPESLKPFVGDVFQLDDLAGALGVTHYEEPPPSGSAGDLQAKASHLPYGLGKTDQENVQNMDRAVILGKDYLVTRKKDGSSCTITFAAEGDDIDIHITSRSIDLKLEAENVYTQAAKPVIAYIVEELGGHLKQHQDIVLVLRGEVTASFIQRKAINIDAKGEPTFWCFEAFCMDKNGGVIATTNKSYFSIDKELTCYTKMPKLQTVPIIKVVCNLQESDIDRYLNAPASEGEGVVLWEIIKDTLGAPKPTGLSFKIRSKEYDSKM